MYIEKQPDKRLYVSGGIVHIEPKIQVNKFEPSNCSMNELLNLGNEGLKQYKECKKDNIPNEYLGGCKDGLYKMHKALSYYALTNEEAKELKSNIDKELNITNQSIQHSNLNTMFSNVTRENMQNKSVYANKHSMTNETKLTESQLKQYEKMMLPR